MMVLVPVSPYETLSIAETKMVDSQRRRTSRIFNLYPLAPSGSKPPHQVHNPYIQGIGQDLERLERDVALAPFDLPYVRPMQTCLVGKQILRPSLLSP